MIDEPTSSHCIPFLSRAVSGGAKDRPLPELARGGRALQIEGFEALASVLCILAKRRFDFHPLRLDIGPDLLLRLPRKAKPFIGVAACAYKLRIAAEDHRL